MQYGTLVELHVIPGHEEELLKHFKYEQELPEGGLAWLVMNPDEKDHWIGVGVFESKEAYQANANRPEQHEWYLKMMEHLESEPVWTDGTYVIGQGLGT